MLDGLSLSASAQRGQHGHSSIMMRNVTSLLVSGGEYEDTNTDIQVAECEAWGETVNCTEVFLLGGARTIEQAVFLTLIGRAPTRLCSHWPRNV